MLVPFPFTDLASKKLRPVLVVSNQAFNRGPDIVACAVTSNLANDARSVLLEAQPTSGPRANGCTKHLKSKHALVQLWN